MIPIISSITQFQNKAANDKEKLDISIEQIINQEYYKGKKILYGPPYCSGELHMGNGAAIINKDFYLRYNALIDEEANKDFIYTLDCQGLPIESKVEKEYLNKNIKRKEVSSEDWINSCINTAETNSNKIINQYLHLNPLISFTKENILKTNNLEYKVFMLNKVKQLYDKGKLKFGRKHFEYCSHCESTMSNAEIEKKDIEKQIYIVPFRIKENSKYIDYNILIATTCPLTLLNNYSIVLRSNETYHVYQDSQKRKYILCTSNLEDVIKNSKNHIIKNKLEDFKITKEKISSNELENAIYENNIQSLEGVPYKVYTSEIVKTTYDDNYEEENLEGLIDQHIKKANLVKSLWLTAIGAVHLSPWDSEIDFNVLLSIYNQNELNNNVNKHHNALFKKVKEIERNEDLKKSILIDLKQKSLAIVKYASKGSICWRCKKNLLTWNLNQIFLQEDYSDRKHLVDYIQNQLIVPQRSLKSKLKNYINKNHPWCISRSRLYGTPFPFGVCVKDTCTNCRVPIPISFKLEDFKQDIQCYPLGINEVIKRKDLKCTSCSSFLQGLDFCMDVWLDSGLLPYYKNDMPYDFVVEGVDQISGWYHACLVLGNLLGKKVPFKGIIFTPWLLSKDNKKLSKSEGAGSTFIEDLKRVGLLNYRSFCNTKCCGMNVVLDDSKIFQEKKFVNNILNIKKFLDQEDLKDLSSPYTNIKQFWDYYKKQMNTELKDFLLDYLIVRDNFHRLIQVGKLAEAWNLFKNYVLHYYSRNLINSYKNLMWNDELLKCFIVTLGKDILKLCSLSLGDL